MTEPLRGSIVRGMAKAWKISGAVFLAGLAGFGVLIHYGFTAEYGNNNASHSRG